MTECPYGFRIVGGLRERRRLVDAGAAFAAYASCDVRAQLDREAYLSAFQFSADFREYLESMGSTKGFNGPCGALFVWFDVDNDTDPQAALNDTRRLAATILDRYRSLEEDDLLLFFSGSKGYHIGLLTCWTPPPSLDFHRVARQYAEGIAALAGVKIDPSIYDKVRAFRAPNSRHQKTSLHKRRLTHEELMGLSLERIRQLAETPEPFDLPSPARSLDGAAKDWADAVALVRRKGEEIAQRRAAVADGTPRLNKATLDFIRDGADTGDRHRMLFSAAANLAEFSCSPDLAHALLADAALDSGLSPSDVRRQIECGFSHVKGNTHE